jgi:tRNA-Thr(GGU) m(6)t(6)A37 methyltransferase TsaA
MTFTLKQIGIVESALTQKETAPRQGHEGAPDAWIAVHPDFHDAMSDLAVGDEVILLTWFHQADRDVQKVYPRNDTTKPLTGVFATRSPDRPNPIGLHEVTIKDIKGNKIKVGPLEAINGTPVVDIKPVL